MSGEFETSQQANLKAIKLLIQFGASPYDYAPAVQRIRRQKDPGLARVWQDTTGILNSTLYDIGAGVSYTAMRFELDRISPRFRVTKDDSEQFRADFVRDLAERAATPEGTVIEEAERIVNVSNLTVRDWFLIGPNFRRFLEVIEQTTAAVGLGSDHKLLYLLGTLSMINPIMHKLSRR